MFSIACAKVEEAATDPLPAEFCWFLSQLWQELIMANLSEEASESGLQPWGHRQVDSYAPHQPVGPNIRRSCARRTPSHVLNSSNLSQEPVMLLTVFCIPAYQTRYLHTITAPNTALLGTRVQGKQVPVKFCPAFRRADFLKSLRFLSWLQYVPQFLKTNQLFQRNMKLMRRTCQFIHNICSSTNM